MTWLTLKDADKEGFIKYLLNINRKSQIPISAIFERYVVILKYFNLLRLIN